jgi:hypothetical protein
MPSPREQYESTVHLFIGKGRSPCRITFMPFTFINNSSSLSRFLFSAVMLKLFYAQLRDRLDLRHNHLSFRFMLRPDHALVYS